MYGAWQFNLPGTLSFSLHFHVEKLRKVLFYIVLLMYYDEINED